MVGVVGAVGAVGVVGVTISISSLIESSYDLRSVELIRLSLSRSNFDNSFHSGVSRLVNNAIKSFASRLYVLAVSVQNDKPPASADLPYTFW